MNPEYIGLRIAVLVALWAARYLWRRRQAAKAAQMKQVRRRLEKITEMRPETKYGTDAVGAKATAGDKVYADTSLSDGPIIRWSEAA